MVRAPKGCNIGSAASMMFYVRFSWTLCSAPSNEVAKQMNVCLFASCSAPRGLCSGCNSKTEAPRTCSACPNNLRPKKERPVRIEIGSHGNQFTISVMFWLTWAQIVESNGTVQSRLLSGFRCNLTTTRILQTALLFVPGTCPVYTARTLPELRRLATIYTVSTIILGPVKLDLKAIFTLSLRYL